MEKKKNRKVLLVDDEVDFVDMLARKTQDEGVISRYCL